MKETTYHSVAYNSKAFRSQREYGVIVPEWDGILTAETPRLPLLIMLHGMDGDRHSWWNNTRLRRWIAHYNLVTVFYEGENGWYSNGFDGKTPFEDDFFQDFLPHVEANLPVAPYDKRNRAIGGFSMGGYGAIKLVLKQPEKFSLAISHSGSLEKPRVAEDHPVFGHPTHNRSYRGSEDVFLLAERAACNWITERPFLLFDCGKDDELLEGNHKFRDHLNFLGYPHAYREMSGHHTFPYWDRAFKTALPEIAHRLGATVRK